MTKVHFDPGHSFELRASEKEGADIQIPPYSIWHPSQHTLVIFLSDMIRRETLSASQQTVLDNLTPYIERQFPNSSSRFALEEGLFKALNFALGLDSIVRKRDVDDNDEPDSIETSVVAYTLWKSKLLDVHFLLLTAFVSSCQYLRK